MQLSRIVIVALCTVFRCEHEHPSDPLRDQRAVGRSVVGERSGRGYSSNEFDDPGSPTVVTSSGALEGYVMETIKGRQISAFEGIPYAEDTGGSNRFMPAIPKGNWTGTRPAKSTGSKCIQLHLIHGMQLVGSEDCLFLNVYTPRVPSSKKHPNLPVLVFLHGGSWFFGAGSEYGPAYLLEHDIILVTVNYRLGIFGFLSTGDEVLPGNLGLKDQSLGLKWVQKNIKAFGGNPQEVTIAGQSSGAASVHLHMMSRMSRGTFARAISMSGNAFSSWSISNRKNINHRNSKLARASRCPQRPSESFVKCLKGLSERRLTRLFLRVFDGPAIPAVPLAAVIEPDLPGAFLTAHPDDLYARNEVAPVPWICSRTLNESQALFSAFNLFGLAHENFITRPIWRRFSPIFLDYQFIAKDANEITEKIKDFYVTKSHFPTEGNIYAELSTDRIFGYGVHKSLQIHSQLAPTYSWLYGYQGRSSLIGLFVSDPKEFGVSHTDDLPIYFNMSEFYPGYKTTDKEYAVVKLTTSLMANFVIQGEPLYNDEEGNKWKIWDPVTDPQNIRVLSINEEVKMIPEPHRERYKFWEQLGLSDMKPYIPIK